MRCAGQECGGGPDSSGPRGLQQGRGQGGRGQRPGARREGRVAAGSGGGGPRAWRGLGIPAKALEVMGRSLGSGGPGARGSLPLCAAVVRCPVPAGLSEAPGPAAPAPPPSALPPPPDGARSRPAGRSPRGPRPLLVQASAFKSFGLLTQPQRLSWDWPAQPSWGPRKGPEQGQRPGQRRRERLRESAASGGRASPSPAGRRGEEGRTPSPHGTSPSGVADPGTQGMQGRNAGGRDGRSFPAGGPAAAQRSEPGEHGERRRTGDPICCSLPRGRPRFLPWDESRQGPLFFPNQGEDEVGIMPAQSPSK